MTRKELMEWLRCHPGKPISSKKVIQTTLTHSSINPRLFLEDVNINGLQEDDLIIGLKAKERELKVDGRYLALMSFHLRLYFVLTEKLLAHHIVPRFDALTMTDNLTKVFKKLMDRIGGQGTDDYQKITYAYHLDYE